MPLAGRPPRPDCLTLLEGAPAHRRRARRGVQLLLSRTRSPARAAGRRAGGVLAPARRAPARGDLRALPGRWLSRAACAELSANKRSCARSRAAIGGHAHHGRVRWLHVPARDARGRQGRRGPWSARAGRAMRHAPARALWLRHAHGARDGLLAARWREPAAPMSSTTGTATHPATPSSRTSPIRVGGTAWWRRRRPPCGFPAPLPAGQIPPRQGASWMPARPMAQVRGGCP